MSQLQRLVIAPSQFENQHITLTSAQQHYLWRVLRLQEGDRFIAVDGTGRWLLSELTSSPDQARVLDELDGGTELPIAMTLMIAMPKQGMDDIVRCCTELGVTTIQPVVSDRTILKPSPQKVQRWQRIAEEAAEQSERRVVPQVIAPGAFSTIITQWAIATPHPIESPVEHTFENTFTGERSTRKGYVCVARQDAPHLLHVLTQLTVTPSTEVQNIILAVGPEGGWTPEEIEMAIAHGFQAVSLGQRILRAVTAPMVALSLVASVMECVGLPARSA
ncbi:MAG: 16S rRNA (uracil(1498)-N(3))-methyltransferase [Leptolyngbyaceae bacterium]|nr:16S rRNA (uracil(1498)-N(3))-methyltransferase [Leptolyngbyaceae bacterium]